MKTNVSISINFGSFNEMTMDWTFLLFEGHVMSSRNMFLLAFFTLWFLCNSNAIRQNFLLIIKTNNVLKHSFKPWWW